MNETSGLIKGHRVNALLVGRRCYELLVTAEDTFSYVGLCKTQLYVCIHLMAEQTYYFRLHPAFPFTIKECSS
jgi:hypothetical protein